jgi:elongation factor Ts
LEISVSLVRELREQTGAGVMACKEALKEVDGDLNGALELLRLRGVSVAAKKSERETKEGIVEAYIHSGGRVGVIVELNCETDFVARTLEFRDLAHNIAMQVAAMRPTYVSSEEMPEEDKTSPEETCLLAQPFIKDSTKTIRDLINDIVAKVGENIRVRRFSCFSLGE